MNIPKLLSLPASAALLAASAHAGIVEQWTFDGDTPETGVNGVSHDTWTTASPNSVPSPGILRYATGGNGSTSDFTITAVGGPGATELIMTIELADFRLGYDAGGTIRTDPVFQISTDGGALELELNSFSSGGFSPDLEQGSGSTDDLDAPVIFDWDDITGGVGPMTFVATWDFADQSMSLDWSGAYSGSASGAAANLANVTEITGFRVRGDDLGADTYMDLDTVTIKVIPEPSAFALFSASLLGMFVLSRRSRR
jgi:hypothetical protein